MATKSKTTSDKPKATNVSKTPKTTKVASTGAVSKVKKETVVADMPVKEEKKVAKSKTLSTEIYDIKGTKTGTLTLPEQYFAANINKQLIAQAVRVYLANQREGSASAKTRGQVEGSSRKIFKQKGTGNARHGNIRAPIFVGGGKALGPVPHSFRLEMPKKMKTRAVASALTHQYNEGSIKIVENMHKLELKTKAFVQLLSKLDISGKTLVLLAKDELVIRRAIRNISHVDILPVSDVNTYAVMHHKHILFTKEAVAELSKN